MNVEKLVNKLNEQMVTLVSTEELHGRFAEVSTLKDRLETSCEEGCLISGKELNSEPMDLLKKSFLIDNEISLFDNNMVYCVSIEEIYEVGKSFRDCVNELSRGYISQLGNYQPSDDEEEYWVTIFGIYPHARLNKDNEVILGD
ncbi:hypothetical protein [Liquorilactobacillus hordei]|uniref:hypothetical protein n=1 Tax=Liquorilactobacillus hordei TaxID=468911 RepID=UPI0039E7A5BF